MITAITLVYLDKVCGEKVTWIEASIALIAFSQDMAILSLMWRLG